MPAKVDAETCIGCESCVPECPSEAIIMDGDKAKVKDDLCVDCGVCIDACPVDAISLD